MYERKIDIIKHDDFIELVRDLIQLQKIQCYNPLPLTDQDQDSLPSDVNEILKKSQMSALKPDILVLSQLLDVFKNA